jgi:sugar/nucleoside kinase (ribokinase family)
MAGLPPFSVAPPPEVDRFRDMTVEQRLELFLELCDLTDSIVATRPDAAALRAGTPRSEEAEALWRRLMKMSRGGG